MLGEFFSGGDQDRKEIATSTIEHVFIIWLCAHVIGDVTKLEIGCFVWSRAGVEQVFQLNNILLKWDSFEWCILLILI